VLCFQAGFISVSLSDLLPVSRDCNLLQQIALLSFPIPEVAPVINMVLFIWVNFKDYAN
jgi:hypothetical protein